MEDTESNILWTDTEINLCWEASEQTKAASALESRITSVVTGAFVISTAIHDWQCLDAQIRSNHLQTTVRTVCLKDLICGINLIFLQSEQSLKVQSHVHSSERLYLVVLWANG